LTQMESATGRKQRDVPVLVTSVFVISICALIYELLISSLSSYLLGSSVLHFSLTIGLFMSFMGVGSYLSKYLEQNRHSPTKLMARAGSRRKARAIMNFYGNNAYLHSSRGKSIRQKYPNQLLIDSNAPSVYAKTSAYLSRTH